MKSSENDPESSHLQQEVELLKSLLTSPGFREVDRTGLTLLMAKAEGNALLDPLGAKKMFHTEAVCRLTTYFHEFNQVHFSKLESYIKVSRFSPELIVNEFRRYVMSGEEHEDVGFVACVARSVQHLMKGAFNLSFIKERFGVLEEADPWLLAELTIECNWEEGVKLIERILKRDPDATYLFTLLSGWMNNEDNRNRISDALNCWYGLLKNSDQEIMRYYSETFGYRLLVEHAIREILNGSQFTKFLQSKQERSFATLSTAA